MYRSADRPPWPTPCPSPCRAAESGRVLEMAFWVLAQVAKIRPAQHDQRLLSPLRNSTAHTVGRHADPVRPRRLRDPVRQALSTPQHAQGTSGSCQPHHPMTRFSIRFLHPHRLSSSPRNQSDALFGILTHTSSCLPINPISPPITPGLCPRRCHRRHPHSHRVL